MLRIQQFKRIDFQELVKNQLFDYHPKIQDLRKYYRKFYKGTINDKERIQQKINHDYVAQIHEMKELRIFKIQYLRNYEQNSKLIIMFRKLLFNEDIKENHKLQLQKLIANLQFQNFVHQLQDPKLKNTIVFVLRKQLIYYQIRKIKTIYLTENQKQYAAWQSIYVEYFTPFLSDYNNMELNDYYYSENFQKLLEDDENDNCSTFLSQLSMKVQEQDIKNFNKYFELLNTDQLDLFNQ